MTNTQENTKPTRFSRIAFTESVHNNIISNFRFAYKTKYGEDASYIDDAMLTNIIADTPSMETGEEYDKEVLQQMHETNFALKHAAKKNASAQTISDARQAKLKAKIYHDITGEKLSTPHYELPHERAGANGPSSYHTQCPKQVRATLTLSVFGAQDLGWTDKEIESRIAHDIRSAGIVTRVSNHPQTAAIVQSINVNCENYEEPSGLLHESAIDLLEALFHEISAGRARAADLLQAKTELVHEGEESLYGQAIDKMILLAKLVENDMNGEIAEADIQRISDEIG